MMGSNPSPSHASTKCTNAFTENKMNGTEQQSSQDCPSILNAGSSQVETQPKVIQQSSDRAQIHDKFTSVIQLPETEVSSTIRTDVQPIINKNITSVVDSACNTGRMESSKENLNCLKSVSKNDGLVSRVQMNAELSDRLCPASAKHTAKENENPSLSGFYLSDQTSMMSSSYGGQFDMDLWKMLQTSARCKDTNCDNASCVQVRKYMTVLQDMRTPISILSEPYLMLLHTMVWHTFWPCSHINCPFPWCGDNMDNTKSLEDNLIIMKQRVENCSDYCGPMNYPVVGYMKLSETFTCDSMPVEGKHWVRLCMLRDSRKTILALPINSALFSDFMYWVIKKVPKDGDSDLWDLYASLRQVKNRSIASMLWAANFEDHLLVCSQFENLSLHDCLQGLPTQQLGFVSIFEIMQQLMSATKHLNDHKIVYLYWSSTNILVEFLPGEKYYVKICNFSCSALLDSYDGGQLYLALPPAIISPELRNNSEVFLVSDVWGLGCLLNELVTGKPVWHEHRHLLDEDLHEMLEENPVPDIPSIYLELLPLFHASWETDWTKRKSVMNLKELLVMAYQNNLRNL